MKGEGLRRSDRENVRARETRLRHPPRQHGVPTGRSKRRLPARRPENVVSLLAAPSVHNNAPLGERALSTIEIELVRLRVAVQIGCRSSAAAVRETLVAIDPRATDLVEMDAADPRLPRRVQALFAFIDPLVESPRSLRSVHLDALRYVGFDTDGMVELTRIAAAAIYESSFAAIGDEDRKAGCNS